MSYFCEVKPQWVSLRYKNIRYNLQSYLSNTLKKSPRKFNTSEFLYPKELLNWFENERNTKTLVLIGESGFGKTQGMKSLLDDYNPLLIKKINALKNYIYKNEAIDYRLSRNTFV